MLLNPGLLMLHVKTTQHCPPYTIENVLNVLFDSIVLL